MGRRTPCEDYQPFSSNTGVSIVIPPWRSFQFISLAPNHTPTPAHTEDIRDCLEDLLPEDHVRPGPYAWY
jgi:hypothetical protein